MTPATGDATPMSTLIANAIKNMYRPWAAAQTQTNETSFANAEAQAKAAGTEPPTSYVVWTANELYITALMNQIASGVSLSADEWASAWAIDKIFTMTSVTPVPVAPALAAVPAGFPIGSQITATMYIAEDVAPFPIFPNGFPWQDARGSFLKHLYSLAGMGSTGWWEKLA